MEQLSRPEARAKSVPPKTMAHGNPAKPIAGTEISLALNVWVKEFATGLQSVAPKYAHNALTEDRG